MQKAAIWSGQKTNYTTIVTAPPSYKNKFYLRVALRVALVGPREGRDRHLEEAVFLVEETRKGTIPSSKRGQET